MGFVRVKVRVCNPEQPEKCQEIQLLADSGAAYSIVPAEMLHRLGIKPVGKRRFRLADGSMIERDYGLMRIELGEQVGATRVVFGGAGDAAVLGVTSLEELELKINPVTGELEPLELLLLANTEVPPRLIEFIEKLKANPELSTLDEARTKQGIVLPLLQILGWDVFNTDEVSPEFSAGKGRVDYCLRLNGLNKFFIEVKKSGEELEGHQEQLLAYSFEQGVELAALTNGIAWWFYLPLEKGEWKERKFYAIDIKLQDPSDVASKFSELLAKDNVQSGQAVRNAISIKEERLRMRKIEDSLPEAWNKIITGPDSLLVDLIAETSEGLCGYKPDKEVVQDFLRTHQASLLIHKEVSQRQRSDTEVGSKDGSESKPIKPVHPRGGSNLANVLEVAQLVLNSGKDYAEATKMVAQRKHIGDGSVRDSCTRRLDLNTAQFRALLKDKHGLISFLGKRFPGYEKSVGEQLSSG